MLQVFITVPVMLVFLAMTGFFLHGLLMKIRKRARASDGLNHLLMNDDLPDIEDLHLLFSPRTDNERSLPKITTNSVTFYAQSVSTILDAWPQIACQQILAS
jgi:hypothetical protein